MFILFFITFIILCGMISVQITYIGVILAVLLYWFSCKYLDYGFKHELRVFRKSLNILKFLGILIREIMIANVTVMRMILSSKFKPVPVLVTFRVPFRSDYSRVMLANAITLTPGTITASLEGDTYTVHCLDESLMQGLEDGPFVKIIKKLEV